jgi:hypothetical protein
MELALTLIAILGFLLFILSYLRFVFAGFKHHPVTGALAAIPVLNVLVLPTLWYRTGKFLVFGVFALALAAGAWFMGAERGINKYTSLLSGKTLPAVTQTTQTPVPAAMPESPQKTSTQTGQAPNQQVASQSQPVPATPKPQFKAISIDESKLQSLPGKALYKMSFEDVPVGNIKTLLGRIVRLLDKDHTSIEGRVTAVGASSVSIQQTNSSGANLELPIANIKKLSLMVKKPL